MKRLQAVAFLLGLSVCAAAAQAITNVTFVAFDLETTGFSSKDRIVEIGAVRIRNGKIEERKQWLVNPGIAISPFATEVHSIDDEMVKGKPGFAEAYASFKKFVGDAVLLAHNAPFDARFIATEAHRHGLIAPTNRIIDTLQLARARYPDADSHRLSALVDRLGLSQEGFHRALLDAEHTARLFLAATAEPPPALSLQEVIDLSGETLTFADYAPR